MGDYRVIREVVF